MSSIESWHKVGNKIRHLRKSNGLTLKQIARGSGLSVNTISLVERNEVAPTIETLCKIAGALGVSPSSLFLEFCKPQVVLQRATATECGSDITEEAMQILSRAPVDTGSLPHKRHSILCLCGCVELELDGQSYTLKPGDMLDFNSDAFHRWHNLDQTTGIAVLVLPPQSLDQSPSGN
jgi:transcriptional regulator with XRE-family HTH domain